MAYSVDLGGLHWKMCAEFGLNRAGEIVGPEVKLPQAPKAAQCGRDRPGQTAGDEVQHLQAPQTGKFGRN